MYSITADFERKMIRATLTGFFSINEVAAVARDLQAAVLSLGGCSGEHVVLVDAPGTVIQTQEVVAAFRRMISDAPIKARRIAVVARGSLFQMQTRRILTPDHSALFSDIDEAQEWLFQDHPFPSQVRVGNPTIGPHKGKAAD